jgi:hypothetical protein
MSKIALAGAVSGTATFTIESPATSTNRTLTLPDNTGTIITQNSTPAFASTIGVGGATAAASGAGITFPATQSASSNANTLDDYEEGTWTPVYSGLGGSIGSTAYSVQRGRYTKVGRVVFATAEVELSNKGSWTSGVLISGLPFDSSGATETCMGSVILGFVDFAAGQLYANPRGQSANNTVIYIDTTKDNADREILFTTAVANNSIFYINMVYTTS